ncbi:helix-turn-helix domain-containing protein [Streptomyces atratus]|uniref:helix-turn-helix domain-containing protein n=1 Tax=Streptomyces atratus TaxID=1893 RepID=UPI0021A2A243|nr:helix-turn-helix domain-containing protein [Streptomyces atratus]MCT2542188.1 helix-turn-helix domain-containing protein [Streptomyces atratus]
MTQSSTDTASAHPLPSPKERRRLREAKSLSEEQVAAAMGVTRATVRSWETGRTTPRGRKREAYARLISGGRPSQQATSPSARTKPGAPNTRPKAAVKRAARPAAPKTVARLSKPVTSTKPPSRPPTPVEATGSTAMAPTEPGTTPDLPGTSAMPEPTPTAEPAEHSGVPSPGGLSPDEAFDALYKHSAATLFRQTFLLTGRRNLSRESVARAFALAWERWPEVAVDRDPVGWVRAAAYEYAMSPWHRLRRTHRRLDPPPADPGPRALLDALLELPPSYRRTLLLYDGVGLDLPETAAETEASTPAAAGRLMNARAAVTERLPELAQGSSPAEQSALLHERLGALALAQPSDSLPPPAVIRTDSERRAQLWTRAAISFTVLIIGLTLFTLGTAPTRYETPESPAQQVGGVPPRSGPQKLTPQDLKLQKRLDGEFVQGPARLVPDIG